MVSRTCRPRPARVLTAALLVGVACSTFILRGEAQVAPRTPPPQGQSIPEFMQWYRAQPRLDPGVPSNGAAVLIVKFTDLECPACGLTHQAYKPVLAKFEAQVPGAVRQVVKDYPLDKSCNPALIRTIHEAACEASVAVRLARRQGRGAELEDFLYANQQVLTPETVRKAASLLANVSADDFAANRASVLKSVEADIALAQRLEVTSTPTFVFNGVVVPKVMEPALFEAVINYELRRVGKVK